jgi:hypothetical protein
MSTTTYRYELRRGGEILATGHFASDEPLEVGQAIAIGNADGVVRSIEPMLGEAELRVVVEVPDRPTKGL